MTNLEPYLSKLKLLFNFIQIKHSFSVKIDLPHVGFLLFPLLQCQPSRAHIAAEPLAAVVLHVDSS